MEEGYRMMNSNPFIKSGSFSDTELPVAMLIQRRRLQILVHSCIYYELNKILITDAQFDAWGKELVELQAKYPNIAERICYHDAFKNWEGNTGAFLPYKDSWVSQKAYKLLNYKGENFNNEHTKILQSTGITSSQNVKRKTTSEQRSHAVTQGRRSLF